MSSARPRTSAISGVLYAEDFDRPHSHTPLSPPAQVAVPEPAALVPSFSLGELRAAAEQARIEEREVQRLAFSEAQTSVREQALTAIAEQLRLARETVAVVTERDMTAAIHMLVSLLTAALPGLCGCRAEVDIRSILLQMLPAALHLPGLEVRTHPSLREVLAPDMERLLRGSTTPVQWVGESDMMPGDIFLRWQNGGARRDTTAACERIREAVVSVLQAEPVMTLESL